MPAPKGHQKWGGRKAGVENKVTKASREAFQLLLDGNLEKLQSWIDQTAEESPKDAFYMVMELASHCVPKLKAIEFSGEVQQTVVRFIDAPARH